MSNLSQPMLGTFSSILYRIDCCSGWVKCKSKVKKVNNLNKKTMWMNICWKKKNEKNCKNFLFIYMMMTMMMKANFKRQKKEKCKTEKNNDDKRNPKYPKRQRDIKYTKKMATWQREMYNNNKTNKDKSISNRKCENNLGFGIEGGFEKLGYKMKSFSGYEKRCQVGEEWGLERIESEERLQYQWQSNHSD